MNKHKKLGRGLESLLNSGTDSFSDNDKLIMVAIDDIIPGKYQPRTNIDNESLEQLAQSIKSKGLLQPIIVRESGVSAYEIIAGERRWKASKLAKLTEIPVIIKTLTNEEALAVGLIENLQRENLNSIDEAYAFERLINEFNLTHEKVAKIVGKSRSFITNSLRLLNLPDEIKSMVIDNLLSAGHVRSILTLPYEKQLTLAKLTIKNKLNVRQLENKSKKILINSTKSYKKKLFDDKFVQLENKLSTFTGMKILIKSNNKAGQLIFSFNNQQELNKILYILGYEEKN